MVVKSVVLRKRGALRGIRLISYDSLMRYLTKQCKLQPMLRLLIGRHG
jgi:hypothetical protein